MEIKRKGDLLDRSEIIPQAEWTDEVAGNLTQQYAAVLDLVDDVVFKKYLARLANIDVQSFDEILPELSSLHNVRLKKITEVVYDQDEFSIDKFATVYGALANSDNLTFLLLDSNGTKTDFYLGVRSNDPVNNSPVSAINRLTDSLKGNFPGTKTSNSETIEALQNLSDKIDKQTYNIACVTGTGFKRNQQIEKNTAFTQGIEKLIATMNGQRYMEIIFAEAQALLKVNNLREQYQKIYSQLSPYAIQQFSYGKSESNNFSKTFTKSDSYTKSKNRANGINISQGHSSGKSRTQSNSKFNSINRSTSVNVSAAPMGIGGSSSQSLGVATGKSSSESNTTTKTDTTSTAKSNSTSSGIAQTAAKSVSDMTGATLGNSHSMTITKHNSHVEFVLKRINQKLAELDNAERYGMWNVASYFISNQQQTVELAASTYKSLISGEKSESEPAYLSIWNSQNPNMKKVSQYLANFMMPRMIYKLKNGSEIFCPGSLLSSQELAINMGLPQKSVAGLPVIRHASFGKNITTYDKKTTKVDSNQLSLGNIYDFGIETQTPVKLSIDELTGHTFITGSTGSGKSNVSYQILSELKQQTDKYHFMVIEPAKGEYKDFFGNSKNVSVYGTNPKKTPLLKLNPFCFPEKVHVLEHIDRLVEILNVCWPMYAAMPVILKKAIIKAYQNCGWDTEYSEFEGDFLLYPTFNDVESELYKSISQSSYSEETKGDYIGSLVTRVNSLTTGLNGLVFTGVGLPDEYLFDQNVIVDLSSVGSNETKSLFMGILIMKLNEYRTSTVQGHNQELKHITLLEEAHNILKNPQTNSGAEGTDLVGHSVEMISNSIAEMRTYGEGFIIIDQSPAAVAPAAIRNTNTKIVMRIPEYNDRLSIGHSIGLDDSQIEEVAKLSRGVAVVYQNNWVEPVLVKTARFAGKENQYEYQFKKSSDDSINLILDFLLASEQMKRMKISIKRLVAAIKDTKIDCISKRKLFRLISVYQFSNKFPKTENEAEMLKIAKLVTEIIELSPNILRQQLEADEIEDNVQEFYDTLTERLERKQIKDRLVPTVIKYIILAADSGWRCHKRLITAIKNEQERRRMMK
jgi:hypothetical protein